MSRLTSHLQHGIRKLNRLEDVEQLSPKVWRILGQNGGPYTLQGTCTYLVGTGKKRLLVDTGDANTSDNYLIQLENAIKRSGCIGLDGIVVSHWHHDHIGGVRGVQSKYGPNLPVYKFIPETEEQVLGDGEMSISAYTNWPKDRFTPIKGGDIISTEGASLRVMYSPGHANDLCVFVLEEEDGLGKSMFTSDNVLGEGTGVIMNLQEYLTSLHEMRRENPNRLYPGHGNIVEDGCVLIDEYIAHRMKRVTDVLNVLVNNKDKLLTLKEITNFVYGDALPEQLLPPAMWNVQLSLGVLVADGKCETDSLNRWRAKF